MEENIVRLRLETCVATQLSTLIEVRGVRSGTPSTGAKMAPAPI
jgi:hypothetical protein